MTDHRTGPVRSEAARAAILSATARIFAAKGYDRLTMEGIAAEAGVGKQTIYRWWNSKGALITECLLEGHLLPEDFTPPDTGDLRADLRTWLGQISDFISNYGGGDLVRSLVAAAAGNEDVGRRLQESFGADEILASRLRAAVDAGDLRRDAPVQEISQALLGALIVHALSRAPAPDEAFPDRLVDAVLG